MNDQTNVFNCSRFSLISPVGSNHLVMIRSGEEECQCPTGQSSVVNLAACSRRPCKVISVPHRRREQGGMPATSASAAAAADIKFRVALEESLHYNLQCCLLLLQHVEMSQ